MSPSIYIECTLPSRNRGRDLPQPPTFTHRKLSSDSPVCGGLPRTPAGRTSALQLCGVAQLNGSRHT